MDRERLVRMQRADEIDQAEGSPDELEELIAEMTAKDPNFPRMLEEAIERHWTRSLNWYLSRMAFMFHLTLYTRTFPNKEEGPYYD
jgi:hypothetical protein